MHTKRPKNFIIKTVHFEVIFHYFRATKFWSACTCEINNDKCIFRILELSPQIPVLPPVLNTKTCKKRTHELCLIIQSIGLKFSPRIFLSGLLASQVIRKQFHSSHFLTKEMISKSTRNQCFNNFIRHSLND